MEAWRKCWREGFAPLLSKSGLVALRKALEVDDKRLLQGATTEPPPLDCVQDWAPESACAVGFCGWQGDGLETVGEVDAYFVRVCFLADERLGNNGECRWFLNWFDETPRYDVIAALLPEVDLELERRAHEPVMD